MMRVSVQDSKCVGGGLCVLAAPQLFDQGENDGIVVLLSDSPPNELHEAARQAASDCPARVISIDED